MDPFEKHVEEGRVEDIRRAIRQGLVPTSKHLIYAAGGGHSEVVRVLLRNEHVDPSYAGNMAIKLASERGHVETVRILMTKVDISQCKYSLAVAPATFGYLEVVRCLLSKNGRLGRNEARRFVEHFFPNQYMSVVRASVLIGNRSKKNLKRALRYAVANRQRKLARLIASRIRDPNCVTTRQLAVKRKLKERRMLSNIFKERGVVNIIQEML